ncbi:hypothetical protein LSH36_95g08022 [Paralvinella palmiformis]|uniref:C2HC/C3H-type domain-containing protein n=1 Tax=Paralvinella palmiformis TaxID=53620 RepID=A0AAD9NCY4_9ANNE|nr:hypothetical protein LSH36_95g08022 [Paralvinella palmiformis]
MGKEQQRAAEDDAMLGFNLNISATHIRCGISVASEAEWFVLWQELWHIFHKIMEYDAFSSTSTQSLIPCDICGRNFNPDALQRHVPICSKNNAKRRKTFDSSKQRIEGTEIKQFHKNSKTRQPQVQPQAAKKGDWRRKHEEFISAIRNAKGVQKAMERGEPLPPPPPPTINPANNQGMPKYSAGNRMNNKTDNDSFYGSMSGRALRTGRNTETYSEARELSAKQRQSMPTKRYPLFNSHRTQNVDSLISIENRDFSPRFGGHINTNTGPVHGAPIRNGDLGYYSGDSDTQRSAKTMARLGSGAVRFCHECGTKYPVETAKFCCECGVRRINIK